MRLKQTRTLYRRACVYIKYIFIKTDIYLRFAIKKLLVIVARFDGPLSDSAMLKHVIVIHYLQVPKTQVQNNQRKTLSDKFGSSSYQASYHCQKL